MTEPLDGYKPRSWSTYIVNIVDAMGLPTRPLTVKLVSLAAESGMAKAVAELDGYDPNIHFFYDFEQVVSGHDAYPCGPVCELASEYEGHGEGKLCFVSYEGMGNEPPTYVFYVED